VSTIILFDVDGTLVLTGGAGARSMALAFEEIFSIRDAFAGIAMPGRTDAWILADAAALHGIPAGSADLARFREIYLRHLARELQHPGPRKGVMPGVNALLDTLVQREQVYLALLTGNYEDAARIKLEYFDLWRYFRCGAFGDDASDRNQLLPRAMTRVSACGGPAVPASQVVVIGDTPLDVQCAAAGGARSIAVATGNYDVAALEAAGADMVLRDLSDAGTILDFLRIAD
jgi:phosphoglycolate phosphatase